MEKYIGIIEGALIDLWFLWRSAEDAEVRERIEKLSKLLVEEANDAEQTG